MIRITNSSFDFRSYNGTDVMLIPKCDNPLHSTPITAWFYNGYFYCEGSNITEGPDYSIRDVFNYISEIQINVN